MGSEQAEGLTGSVGGGESARTSLAHLSTEYFAVVEIDGTVRTVDPSAHWVLGYDADESEGRNVIDLVHPDDLPSAVDGWQQVHDTPGAVSQADFRLRRKDGTWRWFQIDMHNLVDDPNVRGIAVHVRDINDRRVVADELRESEQRLEALLRHADGVTILVGTDGEIRWMSAQGARGMGLSNEEYVRADRRALVHPDDVVEVEHQYNEVASTAGATARVESRLRHADGSWRWFEVTLTNWIDEPAVQGVVANLRDITERTRAEHALRASEEKLEHQATHDPLTGLPNRTALQQRAEAALARAAHRGSTVAVLFLDLDQFKVVNDSQGHATGDRLLRSVASRLASAVPDEDMIARFGGDEFVILSEDLPTGAAAIARAHEILAIFGSPFGLPSDDQDEVAGEVHIDASIGIALSTGDGATPDELIRDADAAMYKAKAGGRGRCELFDEALRTQVVSRHHRRVGLRRAIDEDQFEVHYQPIVELVERGTRMAGGEALVRWRHPDGHLLPPKDFIEEAEETGLIVQLGGMVLASACAFWAPLPAEYGFLSVNLSARQLAEPTLLGDVAATLEVSQLPGHRLHLEITESTLMADPEESISALSSLQQLGVHIAVDDFGTGYSSFAYLRRLPVASLKIDKTFIDSVADDATEAALVLGMCQLGHTLGLTVVAEGVETVAQLEVLRELGCDQAQGYLFARPLPSAELEVAGRAAPRAAFE